jgi:RNA polymerase sigma-70 factor (ECF subfamily)
MGAHLQQKPVQFLNSDTEFDLIQRSQRKDKLAFNELIEQHQKWLYAIAVSHLRNAHDAEDVVQESLLRAWIFLPQLQDRTKFRHWLAKIVLNQCSNYRRGKQRKMVLIPDLPDSEQWYIEQSISNLASPIQVDEVMKKQVEDYLEKLPEKYKTLLYLRYVSGCSLDEISKIMKLSKKNVILRINYGKKILRRRLQFLPSKEPSQK